MNISHVPTSGPSAKTCLVDIHSETFDLERYAAAYAQFDAQMTAQLQGLETQFRQYWTPQAKKDYLGRR
jgi:hypothetical protein